MRMKWFANFGFDRRKYVQQRIYRYLEMKSKLRICRMKDTIVNVTQIPFIALIILQNRTEKKKTSKLTLIKLNAIKAIARH